MRLARWVDGEGTGSEGFVVDDLVVPFPSGVGMQQVLEGGLSRAEAEFAALPAGGRLPLDRVRLLAPLRPAAIRDFVAFEEHVEGISAAVDGRSEVVPEWYEAPTFYFTNPHTVLGPDDVVRPPVSARLDVELELAAVVGGPSAENLDGRGGRAAIFGYTVMNDWSARDLQAREMKVRLGPAKGKDFALSLGPWIVTADELEPYEDDEGFLQLRAEVRIRGELVGEDLVANMGWPFGELVSYASRNSRIVPGDVLGSGTVGNGGCLGELWGRRGSLDPSPLAEGDEVVLSIEGIGELRNLIGPSVTAPLVPPARPRPRRRHREDPR